MAAKKKRTGIPKATREAVEKEFNHQCAICGGPQPQLHHIDEDPSNNDPQNLIPLCPNCHLTDQHNPTAPVDPKKLALFRRYKDPEILSPQFEPLFRRLKFLIELDEEIETKQPDKTMKSLGQSANELIRFVGSLQMGTFYGQEFANLIEDRSMVVFSDSSTNEDIMRQSRKNLENYHRWLLANREKTLELAVELLRYQDWKPETTRDRVNPGSRR